MADIARKFMESVTPGHEFSIEWTDCGHQYCPGRCSKVLVCSCGWERYLGGKDESGRPALEMEHLVTKAREQQKIIDNNAMPLKVRMDNGS